MTGMVSAFVLVVTIYWADRIEVREFPYASQATCELGKLKHFHKYARHDDVKMACVRGRSGK